MPDDAAPPIACADFARLASYMAQHSAKWAGDCLTPGVGANEPMRQEAIKRFAGRINQWLGAMGAKGEPADASPSATGAGQADATHPFIAANAGTMFRWIAGIACNPPGSPVHPGLRAEMDAFMGRAIRAGIDVIAISEEP